MDSIQFSTKINLHELRQFLQQYSSAQSPVHADSQEFEKELVPQLHYFGLLQIITPAEFDGANASMIDLIHITKELGYWAPAIGATFIGNLLGYSAVVLYAQDTLRKAICEEVMKKPLLWSFAMTEGVTGSDLHQTKTTVREVEGGYLLSGEKNFITNATYSDHMTVFARHIDRAGNDLGISAFYVNGLSKGLERGPKMSKVGWKRANTGTLFFNDVFLEGNQLLGKPGEGLSILTHCLNRSKTLLGALAAGIAYRSIDLTTERLTETERFNKPLMDQPAIRHQFAKLHTELEASWLLTCRAASTWDAGLPAVKEASMAKMYGGNISTKVVSVCMELFGARGVFHDYRISQLWNDAKIIEIVEGPSLVQELLIASYVLPPKKNRNQENQKFKLTSIARKKAS